MDISAKPRRRGRHDGYPDAKRPVDTKRHADGRDWVGGNLRFLIVAACIRLLSCFVNRTFFVADEFWQSTEVAHVHQFGYGALTWEWQHAIRSYLYPAVFYMAFKLLYFAGLDHEWLVIQIPHVLQALLTALADVAALHVAMNAFESRESARTAFAMNLSSWFVFYCGSRTLSNTAEMCFVVFALSYFPSLRQSKHHNTADMSTCWRRPSLFVSCVLGGIACIIRPTALFFFVVPAVWFVYINRRMLRRFVFLLLKVLPVLLLLQFGIDYVFYERFVFAHWNFLKLNVFHDISSKYGSHPWNWYILAGLPVVLSVNMIPMLYGIYLSSGTELLWFWSCLLVIGAHSFIAHKEFRFLLPTLPLLNVYAGRGMQAFLKGPTGQAWKRMGWCALVAVNAGLALYFGLLHQAGTVQVMHYLRAHVAENRLNEIDVYFLMPCHSTPFYSYMHRNVSMRYLACDPFSEVEEADMFFADPTLWLTKSFNATHMPRYLVMYDTLRKQIEHVLPRFGYSKEASFFHTHFPDGRVGAYVEVWHSPNKAG